MTFKQVRETIVDFIDTDFRTDFADYPLEYDNRNVVDLEAQVTKGPFAKLFIDHTDYEQASMGANPVRRGYGDVTLTLHVPFGRGAVVGQDVQEWFLLKFDRKQLGDIQFFTPRPFQSRENLPGFKGFSSVVVFYWDEIS